VTFDGRSRSSGGFTTGGAGGVRGAFTVPAASLGWRKLRKAIALRTNSSSFGDGVRATTSDATDRRPRTTWTIVPALAKRKLMMSTAEVPMDRGLDKVGFVYFSYRQLPE
jgi:hypothetical protein